MNDLVQLEPQEPMKEPPNILDSIPNIFMKKPSVKVKISDLLSKTRDRMNDLVQLEPQEPMKEPSNILDSMPNIFKKKPSVKDEIPDLLLKTRDRVNDLMQFKPPMQHSKLRDFGFLTSFSKRPNHHHHHHHPREHIWKRVEKACHGHFQKCSGRAHHQLPRKHRKHHHHWMMRTMLPCLKHDWDDLDFKCQQSIKSAAAGHFYRKINQPNHVLAMHVQDDDDYDENYRFNRKEAIFIGSQCLMLGTIVFLLVERRRTRRRLQQQQPPEFNQPLAYGAYGAYAPVETTA